MYQLCTPSKLKFITNSLARLTGSYECSTDRSTWASIVPLSGTVYELGIIVMKIGIIYRPLLWCYERMIRSFIISRLKSFLDFNPIVRPWEILSMWGSELSSTNRFKLSYLELSLINCGSSSRITVIYHVQYYYRYNNLYVNYCSSCPWNLSKLLQLPIVLKSAGEISTTL